MHTSIKNLLLLFTLAILANGCASVISPHVNESDFLTSDAKSTGMVQLYASEKFRNHTEIITNVIDVKKWKYELGSLAVDNFKYSLMSRFTYVDVKFWQPNFPISETYNNEIFIAIEPSFVSFNANYPLIFKNETFIVKVLLRVKAYNRNGDQLFDNIYQGNGEKKGNTGFESAGYAPNPDAVQLAMRDAVNKAVDDILEIAK